MVKIISLLIHLLNIFNKLSYTFECFLMTFLPIDPSTIVNSEPYKHFIVDLVPIIKPQSLPITFEDAVQLYKSKHNGKDPKPINRRTAISFSLKTKCPHCGDETYVKVKGKHAYVFFMCDSASKIITAFHIYMKRDTFSAIQTFYSVIRKFKAIPEGFNIVVDGNPIYKVAQQYFQFQGFHFDLHQVIGLKNKDEVSKNHRPTKQIIERLNRTFQFSYYVKNGFSTVDKANEFMYLFTAYFNFLRNHKSLGYKPPIQLDNFKGESNMPKKWNMIIDLAYNYAIEQDMQF